MGIILDTGFLFSLVSRQDGQHAAAKETFAVIDWKQRAPVIVPSTVIVETLTLAMYRTKGGKKCSFESCQYSMKITWKSLN